MEGIERIQGRISDIESRIAAIQAMVSARSSVGWGPGLAGAGSQGPYGSALFGGGLPLGTAPDPGASDFAAALGLDSSAVDGPTSFDRTLTDARLANSRVAGARGTTASARPRDGSIPPFTPPASLVAYGNGRIPTQLLEPIGVKGHRLYAPAAESFKRMAVDAAAQGIKLGATDSYRSYDEQVDLAQRKGLYSEGGLAATPGTSKHGWGMALDMDVDARGLAWMRANAERYGFYETTPREPWHWEYRG